MTRVEGMFPREPWEREGEPCYSLYSPEWAAARERIRNLSSARTRQAYDALFTHMEAGWEIIRPLALWAEDVEFGREGRWRAAVDVADFVFLEVTDDFRVLASRCILLVPVATGFAGDGNYADVVYDAEKLGRDLRLLRMAARDGAFPSTPGGMIGTVAEAFDGWMSSLAAVLQPVADVVDRAFDEGEPVPISHPALRVV